MDLLDSTPGKLVVFADRIIIFGATVVTYVLLAWEDI